MLLFPAISFPLSSCEKDNFDKKDLSVHTTIVPCDITIVRGMSGKEIINDCGVTIQHSGMNYENFCFAKESSKATKSKAG
jgi:hypothetical protein